MGMGSIDINWLIERNQELRETCKKMKIDISKFTYGLKVSKKER
jgi:hypothetical protein